MITLNSTTNYRLGDLLIELGFVSAEELQEMLSIASDTGMPIGRVFVLTGVISENDLSNLILCQSYLREKLLGLGQAKTAMKMTREKNVKLDQALLHLGWSPLDSLNKMTPLGELLIAANFISRAQLQAALAQQKKSGLPFGRILIHGGITKESLLAAAINAQILIRDKKISKEQAVIALKESYRRPISLETSLETKGFYEVPKRTTPRIGEILTFAGIVTDSELVSALETGLITQKPVGEVLIQSKLLSQKLLEATLTVQKLLGTNLLSFHGARFVLDQVKDGRTLDEAIQALPKDKNSAVKSQPVSLYSFLKLLRCVDDQEISQAFETAKHNTQIISQILMIGGNMDETSLAKADKCRSLVNEGALTLEHACIVFDYSQRRSMTIADALRELQWQNSEAVADATVSSAVANAGQIESEPSTDKSNDKSRPPYDLRATREMALRLTSQGNYAAARETWEAISKELQPDEDSHHCECLEGIAEAYTLEQNFQQAQIYYQYAYNLHCKIHGSESLSAALAVSNLGRVAYFQQAYSEAEKYAHKYIRLIALNVGSDHPDVACGYQNLATVFHVQSKYNAAENAYKKAAKICIDKLGDSHPTTTRIIRNYASLLQKMDRMAEADNIDPMACGTISGNWRALESPEYDELVI